MEEQNCKECGKKLGFFDKHGNYSPSRAMGYCLKCYNEKVANRCRICGKKLGFWNLERDFAVAHGLMCKSCWLKQTTPEQRLPVTFTLADFAAGKETVVIMVEGDDALRNVTGIANNYGYELINVSSAQSPWTPFTKYTLIFKKKPK